MEELRYTETNDADETKLDVAGFEGTLIFWVIGGAVVSIGLIIVMLVFLKTSALSAGLIGILPFLLTTLFIKLFVNKRPPNYAFDLFELFVVGPSFEFNPKEQPKNESTT